MSENIIEQDDDLTGSIFEDDIDVDEIPDNPNHIPEGTYVCRVVKAVMAKTKPQPNKTQKVGLTIHYQIIEGDYSTAFPFTEWLRVPRKSDTDLSEADRVRAQSRLKLHFKAWGFGADKMGSVSADEIKGAVCKVATRNQNPDSQDERVAVRAVYALEEGESDSGIGGGEADLSDTI